LELNYLEGREVQCEPYDYIKDTGEVIVLTLTMLKKKNLLPKWRKKQKQLLMNLWIILQEEVSHVINE
jgi:hypothetical protein